MSLEFTTALAVAAHSGADAPLAGATYGTSIGSGSRLGNGCYIGAHSVLYRGVTVGHGCTLGEDTTISEGFKHGERLVMEGVEVIAVMCMSNVDGSGRMITIIVHHGGIRIRAGCFVGSLQEFCKRAVSDGKPVYAATVKAAANAFAKAHKDKL